ncbi:unnamed protein product [Adineta ricciae]|uniref:Lysosome-associated membrane glycoprotein 5 n=1 Tax=Adineta ricciae TaxID=249248 RepID=A0A814CWC7_ADIRI|nr:unnamed protein product [Adineta ricciae]
MLSKISSTFLSLVCLILISSTNAVELPGNYTLPKSSSNLCLIARFDLVLNVEYTQIDGKKNISKIPLNNETFQYYDGTCGLNNSHTLTLTLLDNLTTITFDFSMDEKNKTSLSRVLATLTLADNEFFPNCSKYARGIHPFVTNESLFITDRSKSYRCNAQTKIDNFKSEGNVTIKSIDLQNLRIQPFVDNSIIFHDYATGKND